MDAQGHGRLGLSTCLFHLHRIGEQQDMDAELLLPTDSHLPKGTGESRTFVCTNVRVHTEMSVNICVNPDRASRSFNLGLGWSCW